MSPMASFDNSKKKKKNEIRTDSLSKLPQELSYLTPPSHRTFTGLLQNDHGQSRETGENLYFVFVIVFYALSMHDIVICAH